MNRHIAIAMILFASWVFPGCGDAEDAPQTDAAGVMSADSPVDDSARKDSVTKEAPESECAQSDTAESGTAGKSGANTAEAVPAPQKTGLLTAPSDAAIVDFGSTSVILSWQGVSGADGYNIYRSSSPWGTYVKVNRGMTAGTTYADMELAENTLYCYKVSAVNLAGESTLSSAVSQKTANPAMAYVRFCNFGSVSISGMRLGRSWFRPVAAGETTSYVETIPGTYFFEYWNAETLEWEAASTGLFTLQAGRRYTVRDADAAVYLNTDDVLKRDEAAVFIESMSSNKTASSPAYLAK